MNQRKGEKIGWIGGGLGGFVWLLILGIVRLASGHSGPGLLALGFFLAGTACVFLLAPWQHPRTLLWKLLIPLYAVLLAAWIVIGEPYRAGTHWGSWLGVLPVLLPLGIVGHRRWEE